MPFRDWSLDELRQLWDNSPIGLALVSPDGTFEAVNPALCDFLEYSEPELLRLDFQALTPDRDELSADEELVQECLSGKRNGYLLVKRYRTKTDRIRWAALSVGVVRREKGVVSHFQSQILPLDRESGTVRTKNQKPGEVEIEVKNDSFWRKNAVGIAGLLLVVGGSALAFWNRSEVTNQKVEDQGRRIEKLEKKLDEGLKEIRNLILKR